MLSWPILVDLLMPRHCAMCGAELCASEHTVCCACLCKIPVLTWDSIHDNKLLRTLWNHHEVEAAGSSFYYNSSTAFHRLFIHLKYYHHPQVGLYLGESAFPRWHAMGLGVGAEYIVPVPLSAQRLRSRGYNQAAWIAMGIARATGLRESSNVLLRVRDNTTQTHRSGKKRQRNVQGSFAVSPSCPNLNDKLVLLVDDIFTTGATMGDCIRALKERFPHVRIHVFTLGYAGE